MLSAHKAPTTISLVSELQSDVGDNIGAALPASTAMAVLRLISTWSTQIAHCGWIVHHVGYKAHPPTTPQLYPLRIWQPWGEGSPVKVVAGGKLLSLFTKGVDGAENAGQDPGTLLCKHI